MSIVVEGMHHPLYGELAAIVGPKYCSDQDFVRIAYSRDSSPAPSQMQGIVVRPANTEQVVGIVKLANYAQTPIVPSGGRASLYGAPPGLVGKGIVVDMTRMRKVLNIDEVNTVVTVEAGCTVAELTALVNQKGWDVHTALQPYFSDTVGGQISGVQGAGTGMEFSSAEWNGRHLCGVKVVLPDGSVIQTGAGPGTNVNQRIPFAHEPGGPDMTGMFIGDGGVFGIKVEATYRIYRLSKFRDGRASIFDTLDQLWDFLADLSTVEPLPCCVIVALPPTKTLVSMGMGGNNWIAVSLVKGNSEEELAPKLAVVDKLTQKYGGRIGEDAISKSWVQDSITCKRHREMGSFASLGVWTYLELIVPREQVKECYTWVRDLHYGTLDRNNIPYETNFGIVCMGANQWIVTSILFLKGYDHKAMAVMHDLWKEGLEKSVAKGWYPDANQGYGSIAMGKYWSPSTTTFMHSIKKTLDPNNIMNPGLWGL